MRTDFFVWSLLTAEGGRFLALRVGEIPASFFFARSWEEKLRELTLLTEEGFQLQSSEMGLSADEVDYRLERACGLHMSAR